MSLQTRETPFQTVFVLSEEKGGSRQRELCSWTPFQGVGAVYAQTKGSSFGPGILGYPDTPDDPNSCFMDIMFSCTVI